MRRLFVLVCAALLVPVTALALLTGGGLRQASRAISGVDTWLPAPDLTLQPASAASAAMELSGPVPTAFATPAAPGPAQVPPPPAHAVPPPVDLTQAFAAARLPSLPPPARVTVDRPLAGWLDPGANVTGTPALTTTVGPAPAAPSPASTTLNAGTLGPLPEALDPSQTSGASDGLAAWGPPPAPALDPRRFTEAHWQGLEVIPKTAALAKVLRIPPDVSGVVVDDATLPADLQGFVAGDVVTRVGAAPTPDLLAFVQATEVVRDQNQTDVEIFRDGAARVLVLTALMSRLGNANGETPPMIQSASRPPHTYQGPCTNCHRIGSAGQLAIDQGDLTSKAAPAIRSGSPCPHRPRGQCSTCHQIFP